MLSAGALVLVRIRPVTHMLGLAVAPMPRPRAFRSRLALLLQFQSVLRALLIRRARLAAARMAAIRVSAGPRSRHARSVRRVVYLPHDPAVLRHLVSERSSSVVALDLTVPAVAAVRRVQTEPAASQPSALVALVTTAMVGLVVSAVSALPVQRVRITSLVAVLAAAVTVPARAAAMVASQVAALAVVLTA